MPTITLECETDFDGWRKTARVLVLNDVSPFEVIWRVRGDEPEPFEPSARATQLETPDNTFNVSAKFIELAQSAILHRNRQRFALLYRLLWRLRGDHDLSARACDPDLAHIIAMADAVHRDQHRMQASLRFREIGREQKSHYIAWFAPAHHIVAATAPFFARRFADMPWSILTPDACAHWDGHAVSMTSGIMTEAPTEDRLEEEIWRHHSVSIFNPARLKAIPRRWDTRASSTNPPARPEVHLKPEETRKGTTGS